MTISYQDASTVVAGTTSAAVAYPAGVAAGDLLLLTAVNKYSAFTSAPPTGFTLLAELVGGSGGTGADIGNVRTTVWYRIATGSESGTVSVTKATETGTVILARMLLYRRTAGSAWNIVATTGSSSTATTSWSAAGSNNLFTTSGDLVICVTGVNTDGASFTSHALSATGATFGAASERQDSGTTNGHDVRLVVTEHPCTAGTATTFPTFTSTGSTGTPDGTTVFVRIGEGVTFTAEQGTITLSGQDTGLGSDKRVSAETGSIALSMQNVSHVQGSGAPRAWAVGAWGSDVWYGTSWYGQGSLDLIITAEFGQYALNGNDATTRASRRITADYGTYTLAGQDATFARGISMVAGAGSYVVTGYAAGSSRGYRLTADFGSITLLGRNAALYPGSTTGKAWATNAWYSGAWGGTVWADNTLAPGAYILSAETGRYAASQQSGVRAWFETAWADGAWAESAWAEGLGSTNLRVARKMTAEQGSYVYTGDDALRDILLQTVPSIPQAAYVIAGQNATLSFGKSMLAASGSYAVNGQVTNFARGLRISAGFGAHLIIGSDAEFVVGIGEYANTGYYALTGSEATFKRDYRMTADVGSYVVTGDDAKLIFGDLIRAEFGQYALTGGNATFARTRALDASTGYYTIGGQIQPIPEVVIEVPANSGGYFSRRKKRKDRISIYDRLPTEEEVNAEREALGILPKKTQKLIVNEVKKIANVDTRSEAALLANAYLQETPQRNLLDRLRNTAEDQNVKWRDEMFSITHALILDSLRKKADAELLARLIAEEEAENAEVNEILELWMAL